MSEYQSTCPKCQQRILCDSQYAGQRVACPVCFQEIIMPAPANPPTSHPAPASTAKKSGAGRALILIASAVILISAGVAVWVLQSRPPAAIPLPPEVPVQSRPPSPVAAAPAPVVTPAPVAEPEPVPAVKLPVCRARWTFDQINVNAFPDLASNGYNATLVGDDATLVKDAKLGGVLSLFNSNYVETVGPVVDTSKSFTVSAWAKLSTVTGYRTVVSMDGTKVSGFYLQLNVHAGSRFVFNRLDKDDPTGTRCMARAANAPVADTWYHLAGVYDAEAQTVALYVDGALQETVPFTAPWQAAGKTAIGRGYFQGLNRDFFDGEVGDVRFYAAALTADQIRLLASP